MIEHDVTIPAWEKANRMHRSHSQNSVDILLSEPTLSPFKLNLLKLIEHRLDDCHRFFVGVSPPVMKIVACHWPIGSDESENQSSQSLLPIRFTPSSEPLIRADKGGLRTLAWPKTEASAIGCRLKEDSPSREQQLFELGPNLRLCCNSLGNLSSVQTAAVKSIVNIRDYSFHFSENQFVISYQPFLHVFQAGLQRRSIDRQICGSEKMQCSAHCPGLYKSVLLP